MYRIAAILACSVLLSGWTLMGNKFDDEVEEIRKVLADFSKSAVLAIPGERYLDLLERTHSKQDKERGEAQDQVRRMFNIDIGVNYVASVWFEYDGKIGPLRAAIRPGSLNMSGASAKLMTARGEGLTFYPVGATAVQLITDSERDKKIRGNLKTAVHGLFFPPKLPFGAIPPQHTDGVVEALSGAILAGYQPQPSPTHTHVLSIDWDPLKHTYLYVFIPELELKRHLLNLKIRAIVHKSGDTNATLHNMKHVTINPHNALENDRYSRRIDGPDAESIAWTAERLDSNLPAANQMLAARDELDRILTAMQQQALKKK